MTLPDFRKFAKIPRFHSPVTITEKLDGTNAVLFIDEANASPSNYATNIPAQDLQYGTHFAVAGSRKRWLAEGEDNHGFRAWVKQNLEQLILGLDPGTYYGEWWGKKINRGYGLDEKRFTPFGLASGKPVEHELFHPLPILYEGRFFPEAAYECLLELQNEGSRAAPGFKPAEGIVIRFNDTGARLKLTFSALTTFDQIGVYQGGDDHSGIPDLGETLWIVEPKEFPQKGKKNA
jgi:hypothetical protein